MIVLVKELIRFRILKLTDFEVPAFSVLHWLVGKSLRSASIWGQLAAFCIDFGGQIAPFCIASDAKCSVLQTLGQICCVLHQCGAHSLVHELII